MTEREEECKVWLDDNRPAPEGWVRARTVAEAQELLETGRVTHLSLDYDLGFDEPTGYDLVRWMAETRTWPRTMIEVHSGHPLGRHLMIKEIRASSPLRYGL
jgi:hypothetical protein